MVKENINNTFLLRKLFEAEKKKFFNYLWNICFILKNKKNLISSSCTLWQLIHRYATFKNRNECYLDNRRLKLKKYLNKNMMQNYNKTILSSSFNRKKN